MRSVCRDRVLDLAMPAPVRSMKSRTSAMGQSSRRDPADGKREPIGPGAIVVDDKVVNIVTFPLALGRLMQGGLHALPRFSRSVAVATGPPSAEKLARLHGSGTNPMPRGTLRLIVLRIL